MPRPVDYATVFFIGHVQGVGFRYATLQVAKEFDVAGYVCNLPDGRVQLEVEGASAVLKEFIASVGERMHGFVKRTETVHGSRPAQFSGFEIR